MFHTKAPVRPVLRAGAFLILTLLACDRAVPERESEGPRSLELAHDTIQLPDGVSLVEIRVQRSDSGEFLPPRAQARTGDVVRFIAGDRASHAIVFDGETLALAARAYLDHHGQLRSPPLISEGSAWVITLDGAPPGEYPFRCITHSAGGSLSVR